MHNLALQNADWQSHKVHHELSSRSPGRIGPGVAIVNEGKNVEVGLRIFANRQQPLQEPDQCPQIVARRHHWDQDCVRHQYRVTQYFTIFLARIPRRAINQDYIVGIHG